MTQHQLQSSHSTQTFRSNWILIPFHFQWSYGPWRMGVDFWTLVVVVVSLANLIIKTNTHSDHPLPLARARANIYINLHCISPLPNFFCPLLHSSSSFWGSSKLKATTKKPAKQTLGTVLIWIYSRVVWNGIESLLLLLFCCCLVPGSRQSISNSHHFHLDFSTLQPCYNHHHYDKQQINAPLPGPCEFDTVR